MEVLTGHVLGPHAAITAFAAATLENPVKPAIPDQLAIEQMAAK
jgi:hypothetical protein